MPPKPSTPTDALRRLLWWLLLGMLLLGAGSAAISALVATRVELWLERRGVETEIDYLQVSVPRLRMVVRGFRGQNSEGRGFYARELMLDYSWWQLIRGRFQLQRAYLEGAYMDLESIDSQEGRLWEVFGWDLTKGKRKDRDFQLIFDWARIHDSQLCYRHGPAWPTPSCLRFDDLQAQDFLLTLQRSGDEPLQLNIAAEDINLRDLLVGEKNAPAYNSALVELELSAARFVHPAASITAERVAVKQFGSCPPRRWAEALRPLRHLVGHCGTARRLQLEGDLQFVFGSDAEVHWRRGTGQGVKLRHRDRRWQNWRAETIALNDFAYVDKQDQLSWTSGGASAFDWCPGGLRNDEHHYCVRAGTLQLPQPVTFDWTGKLSVSAGPSRLQQTQLLDLDGANRNPLTAHLALLGPLKYAGESRTLAVDGVELESATGCTPGQLWQQPEYCVQLAGLHSSDPFQLRFPSREQKQPWGFASGPLKLGQLRLRREDQPQLQLQKLHWQRINLMGGAGSSDAPLVVQDFGLQALSGCLPDSMLPREWQSLCAELNTLVGSGNFAWRGGADGYAILGELRLERLLLADRLDSDKGLLLQQLHTGEGYMRRDADGENPWIDTASVASTAPPLVASPAPPQEVVDEKGLLPAERRRQQEPGSAANTEEAPIANIASPNLNLHSASLSRLQGCLPAPWARLFYDQPQQMPGCFDMRNLRQHSPLVIAWQGGLDMAVGELTLDRALARTPPGQTLLDLSALRLPSGRIRYLPQHGVFLSLPHLSLQSLYGCLPGGVSPQSDTRCADLDDLRLGRKFQLNFDSRQLAADLGGTLADRIRLQEEEGQLVADVHELLAPQLEILWSRRESKPSRIKVENLSVASVQACLPKGAELRAGLPRCVFSKELRTVGENGLRLGETIFKASPAAPSLWSIESVQIDSFFLSPSTLDLHGLDIQQVLFCGLHDLLPASARDIGFADCITARQLDFVGVSRIGLTPSVPMVELGALEARPVATWQEAGEYVQAGFRHLSWKKLIWDGDPVLWVTDLSMSELRGCAPGAAPRVTVELLEDISDREVGSCYGVREVRLSGTQKIALTSPFSSNGSIELVDLSVGRGADKPLVFERIQLDQFAYGGVPIGRLSGASGCLAAGMLGDSRLAPCYRLGRVEVQSVDRIDTPVGRATLLHGLQIAGVEFSQHDYPGTLPAQLLQMEAIAARHLRIGGGEIEAQQLELQGVSSCIPRGYIDGINHCISTGRLLTSGQYITGEKNLALTQLQLQDIQLLSGDGKQLVRGESVAIAALLSDLSYLRFDWLEAAGFEFFGRREGAPEYHRHSVIGRLAGLRVEQLGYDKVGRRLEIANVDALRPRLILMRNRAGEYPVLEEIAALTGAPPGRVEPVAERAIAAERQFHYHVHDLNVRHGTFTWVDRQGQYRANLPIRAIYLTAHNISNEPDVPPMVVLLNGRPGGFGEIQLAGTIDYLDTRKWNADLTGYINNANLIPATPYMAELLGYKILQGQLDAIFDIRVRENKVDAIAEMKLEKIRVRRVREEDQLPVKSTLIPLNIALLLMEDGNSNVRFSMPIAGDLYDPEFSFSFIFSDLLQSAIMEALFSYFTPLGFYTLAKFAWRRFRAIDFDSIIFQPGSAELSTVAHQQLQEMLQVLREHPEARPGVCGIANPRDWHALHPNSTPDLRGSNAALEQFYRHPPIELLEELEHLALERSRQIERFLIDAGITAAELIPCAPDYNGRDFDEPRVEFSN
ncbi:protein of unknown function [Microbulbifer donghaiensis]|uniref:Uncharacterized protein n=1 Tax=Microbulbifer donghaiensis TaxID=494016 RepID=A0A1M4ZNU8_9GAMM|nr:DUF748 domain-containing protein [Microbulbifer donghaiensis]SHF19713.1 protein of unknown function [Microbulbifer donghaiensis]